MLFRFGRFRPFIRYNYADVTAEGPTPAEHVINLGVVIDGIFGQTNDEIGFGYTWSEPADQSLDNQGAIDAFYRIQLTQELSVSPVLHVVFDPVRNPDEDTIVVWGIRARINL